MRCIDLQVASEVLLYSDRRTVDPTTELSEEKDAREGLPPKSLNLDSSLGSDGYNKLKKSSRPKRFEPALNFGGGFMSSLAVSTSSYLSEHIILILTVDVFHQELLITMRRLHDQLVHHTLSLLADEDLHTFDFLTLPP